MAKVLDKGWNPYLAGALAGLLLVASIWFTGKYAGASTTYVRAIGMVETVFSPERVKQTEYLMKEAPIIDWQWMFVIGIILGSFLSAAQSGDLKLKAVPDLWESRFGPSRLKRAGAAFLGGTIAMFGARLADG